MLTYCSVTNETITAAYKGSVIHLFYVASYEYERRKKENERRSMYMRNGFSGM